MKSTNNSSSILENGKLKPGTYKIQNLHHQNYLDIQERSRQLWGYSAQHLEEGRGIWEIKKFGVGYTVQRFDPGKPDQFCNPMEGLNNGTALYIAAFPIAWGIEVVDDAAYRGFEYIRFHWGTTKRVWDMCLHARTKVQFWEDVRGSAQQMWKLIPVKTEERSAPSQSSSETPGSGSPPSYDKGEPGKSSTRTRHVVSENDEFGTIVNEVTVVTTTSTVTTNKRYRVEDP